MKATTLLNTLGTTQGSDRERLIRAWLEAGYVPAFLNNLRTVTSIKEENTLSYQVMPDYLCLGDDDDYIRMPMTPMAANSFMDMHNLTLPTKTMVNEIYRQANIRIPPFAWDNLYRWKLKKYNRDSNTCYVDMNKKIQEKFEVLTKPLNRPLGSLLVAGHKKDVVLSNSLRVAENKHNVAIYGWFNSDGTVIQGLNPVDHINTYVDYSHGLRMVSNNCVLNGKETTLQTVWADPKYCHLVHDEPLLFLRY